MSLVEPHPAQHRRRTLVLAVVALTWASAIIHAAVVSEHLREWGPAGAFFIAVALAQLAWGGLICRRPTRRWLLVGAYGNAALVGIWLVSRTVGVPIGPEAGHPEVLGAHDALATLNEVFAVGITRLLLTGRTLPNRVTSGSAASLAAASLLAVLIVSPHSHGSSHGHGSPPQQHATPQPHATPQQPAPQQEQHHGGTGHAHDEGRSHSHR
jgi:hypothetical protein